MENGAEEINLQKTWEYFDEVWWGITKKGDKKLNFIGIFKFYRKSKKTIDKILNACYNTDRADNTDNTERKRRVYVY